MKSNRRCLSVALLCSAITFAGLPARAQQYTSDGAVRPDRALSPEETNPGPVLSPGAVRPDRALSPEETDPGPVLSAWSEDRRGTVLQSLRTGLTPEWDCLLYTSPSPRD